MKLISMTDFTLLKTKELREKMDPTAPHLDDLMAKCIDDLQEYAEFLKQPLELWMFVPCDYNGIILKKIEQNPEYDAFLPNNEYYEAENRCLFKGFQYCYDTESWRNDTAHLDEEYIENKTIEDLISFDLELTF